MSMGLDAPGFGYPEPVSYSGLSMLLQYMEGSVAYNSLNYSIPRGDPGNNTVMGTAVSTFLCPSDPQRTLPPGQAGENYRPNSGNGIQYVSGASDPWGFNTSLPPFNGVFYPVSATKIAEITDGTSNTAAFSEMGLGDQSNGIATEKTDQFWTQTWPSTPDQAIADCQSFPASNLAFQGLSDGGVPWIQGSTSAMYNHVNVPNKRSCIYPPGRIVNTANSYHPGGVNVGLCDGSVRFVKDTISLPIWRALGSRNGGEVISADSY
jgi:prepilin-type processing-associated H-X9-DG protein